MPILVRSVLILGTLLLLNACAVQRGVIERPDWAAVPVWDSSGMSVTGHGVSDYSTNSNDEAQLAEENALKEARKLLARELAKAYVEYMATQKETVSEEEAAGKIVRQLGNIVARQRYYDDQRRVYFIQLYLPAHRVPEIIHAVFGVQIKVGENGKLHA
ncbi:hypothetical protein COW36_12425 [bacterium (Candidatus Blackallbacteria) CG17_big_fil_post_rev_8_21_14_2_50_48_46]|uniref:Uncharacterized protein n=1 Tax=bacterium (Candidatus Blackallbacteria) CG17_big_fil_post_rev_8_21_14_2_50_48_46 TaxID=2014261 RepID=A0A2M7G3W0_9BACT|nr:MAG: hypothetical protein COW64_02835 [bacterium (Candidatus Blackallbacteria) CG18_big_fil_WC_8_21_14_2_50_49_26]PIW16566.1 MAG: hypothetical protein COW36_12425 [bacterium (Candidatus Blackallbacteria) CG17_big_fil_post_rev_8_21_14_2_50_48_46]PIW46074.1 MAG: hypothetical protein COW20_17690 [bacterium (Candidatus Blackallbacteria) CG13_big_fil_rev_8_21_14_2_50_49_14]